MSKAMTALKAAYWIVLALLPFLPAYLASKAMVRTNCGYATQCFSHAIPIASEMGIALGVMALLLWPLCFWHLGGRWAWQRMRSRPAA
jgi:hypothetical protein